MPPTAAADAGGGCPCCSGFGSLDSDVRRERAGAVSDAGEPAAAGAAEDALRWQWACVLRMR
eukprot:scaffold289953_cov13-Tisochrysis_lutea.AAC.2